MPIDDKMINERYMPTNLRTCKIGCIVLSRSQSKIGRPVVLRSNMQIHIDNLLQATCARLNDSRRVTQCTQYNSQRARQGYQNKKIHNATLFYDLEYGLPKPQFP